jgi:NADH-quinone oxidoreductase subunit K
MSDVILLFEFVKSTTFLIYGATMLMSAFTPSSGTIEVMYLLIVVLYFFSVSGVLLNLKNILVTLLLVELTYFSVVCLFLLSAALLYTPLSFSYALLVILVAASESVVGLGLLIVIFRKQRKITFNVTPVLQM